MIIFFLHGIVLWSILLLCNNYPHPHQLFLLRLNELIPHDTLPKIDNRCRRNYFHNPQWLVSPRNQVRRPVSQIPIPLGILPNEFPHNRC